MFLVDKTNRLLYNFNTMNDFYAQFEKLITPSQAQDFNCFCDFLTEKNKQFNLTAIKERDEIYVKHFYDSLIGRKYFFEGANVTEVGSGGGFPSVPLKIFDRSLNFTLIEATGKKCEFLRQTAKLLNFENFCVVNERCENFVKSNREMSDIVTARAVASLNVLCELCLPFLKIGGKAVFYKNKSDEEIKQAQNAIKLCGGQIEEIFDYTLPKTEGYRSIIVIKKVQSTPNIYPREYKNILKKPL